MTSSIYSYLIFDFNPKSDLQQWLIVNDDVMGGKSESTFSLNKEGFGVFKGQVSLENNGGFASLRYRCPQTPIDNYRKIVIRLKGDGKTYQFRLKTSTRDYHAYVTNFSTSGDWEEVSIALKDLYPSFRGRKLDMGNFSQSYFSELGFLIGNKKAESFELLIDKIELR